MFGVDFAAQSIQLSAERSDYYSDDDYIYDDEDDDEDGDSDYEDDDEDDEEEDEEDEGERVEGQSAGLAQYETTFIVLGAQAA